MTNTQKTDIPTIVYVEDNSGDALLLEEALREKGHATHLLVIDNGEKALRYFEIKDKARDLPPPHCILDRAGPRPAARSRRAAPRVPGSGLR